MTNWRTWLLAAFAVILMAGPSLTLGARTAMAAALQPQPVEAVRPVQPLVKPCLVFGGSRVFGCVLGIAPVMPQLERQAGSAGAPSIRTTPAALAQPAPAVELPPPRGLA
ncbi:hypothetical protein SAMN02983003_2537 [Devosia enhydra]|uniref:Uncharacterized protein n=1 Tax=Devosia enhydra TaxID=665118 RepID=A0A1K2HZ66_9HYPH|nr:hypothetical protein [Devosia enhydra]SFZ85373.1 hypothetical protein SAMN02983003_2537 [Devosia enhydra]